MYTGIVQALVPVAHVEREEGLMRFALPFDATLLEGLETGASVGVNGVCFTVTRIDGGTVWFDAVAETLALSNIKYLEPGTQVNVERSARQGVEVGGHILSGHVVATARVSRIQRSPNNCRVTFEGQDDWLRYVFNKGFLALNGASLTVADLDREAGTLTVNLIPETLARTNFGLLAEDDEVNVEIEAQTQVIVDTVERVMAERFAAESPAA